MRIYLTLFLFGSVMLTGCADDLVGPAVDTAGITSPTTMRDVAPPSIFKTWEAPDSRSEYRMSFRNTERSNQPIGVDDQRLALAGEGAYNPDGAISVPGEPVERVDFGITGNVGASRSISFAIVNGEGQVMANAKGQADALYTRLDLTIEFKNGSVHQVALTPAEDTPIGPGDELP